ncbi:MAG: ABC transporter permease [Fervidicoccaceae archaeon]
MEAVYRALTLAIELYVKLREKLQRGWASKNSSRIREWKLTAYAFSKSKIGVAGGIITAVVLVLAVIGPYIAWEPYWDYGVLRDPSLHLRPPCLPPSCSGYPILGTDELGRDILSLSLYGVRISVVISAIVVLLGAPLGILLGLVAGYKGGLIDEVIMRLTDVFIAFPALILAIAFASALPGRIRGVLEEHEMLTALLSSLFGLRPQEYGQLAALLAIWLALVLVWWPGYARVVRGAVLSVREQPFVEAAKLIGLPTSRILFKHVLPNVISPVLVMMTFDLATAALFAASLSFLGLGPQEPVAELGFLISKAGRYFPERTWHAVFYFGSLLMLIALGWNLLGDALRDILDPKTRRAVEFEAEEKR